MRINIKINVAVFFILFLLTGVAYAQQGKVEAALSKTSAKTGEVFKYTVKIEGLFSDPKIKLPDLSKFIVVSQSQEKNFFYEKGKLKVKITLVYFLAAKKPGSYKIGKVIVKDKGKTYTCSPLTIKISGKALPKKQRLPRQVFEGAVNI